VNNFTFSNDCGCDADLFALSLGQPSDQIYGIGTLAHQGLANFLNQDFNGIYEKAGPQAFLASTASLYGALVTPATRPARQ
jgi:hypothetical protein